MPHVLMVAYYFPPIGGIGSIRMERFASLLPEFGWHSTVLAPRDTPHAHDPQLQFPEARVVRSRSVELSRVGRTALAAQGEGSASGRVHPLAGALRDAARRYLYFPDPQVGWYPGAVAAGLRTLRSERFDVIYSSSNPMTGHLIARTLSRRCGLPWVAEYRDPWADRLGDGHPYRRVAAAMERSVARNATKVLMPTPTWADHYGRRWNVDVGVLPNGGDTDLPARRRPERPTLTHVGTYYPGEHDLTGLWGALARMRQQGNATLPRLRFVGSLPDALREEIAKFGLVDLVESTGFVPHDEAMREMMSASMLIASGIAGDDPARRGWVPAKLFEYLASGVPVLFLGDSTTDAGRLMEARAGVRVVAPHDVDAAVAALEQGLAEGDSVRDVSDLTREARTRALADILEQARTAPR